ncbi:MAG: restriction endonuclease subunit S [Actinobacteria bacterium]|nr:restriction endonuclease subunit S [Actinomycetota bacterium]MBU1610084.1 restriction endonuclease subunit S [Actinomycetota bacterium]MBU2315548.1 restriction endonuclease subunit S [Actinomycetota bacterium]MBU2385348.1 restriction endonuclease subunit S [Actinomycetota bacterium]
MSDWYDTELGNVCSFRAGAAFPTDFQGGTAGEYPFIKVSDLSSSGNELFIREANNWVTSETAEELKAKPVRAGSVVFAKIGEGLKSERVRLTTMPTLLDNNLMAAIPGESLDPRFSLYLFATVGLSSWAAGSALPYLRQGDLARIPIRLPHLDEQRRIAEVLGALDDLIDTNERLAADAAELRRSLLDAAFALATEQHALSSIARFVNGKNFTKGADGAGRPIIRTPEVREGVKPSTVRSSVEATDDFIARAGDLLFVWSGSLCIGRWAEDEALVNQHVFKVTPNVGVPDWYVYACLEWKLPWFLGLAADKATTMGHIQRAHLDAPVPKLSSDELAHLDASVRPLWELELELSRENEQLRRTRDELLPLLMSGAVRVRPQGVAA